MGMGVGEPRHDDLTAAIDTGRVGKPVEDLAARADRGDPAVSDRDPRGVVDTVPGAAGDERRVGACIWAIRPNELHPLSSPGRRCQVPSSVTAGVGYARSVNSVLGPVNVASGRARFIETGAARLTVEGTW